MGYSKFKQVKVYTLQSLHMSEYLEAFTCLNTLTFPMLFFGFQSSELPN